MSDVALNLLGSSQDLSRMRQKCLSAFQVSRDVLGLKSLGDSIVTDMTRILRLDQVPVKVDGNAPFASYMPTEGRDGCLMARERQSLRLQERLSNVKHAVVGARGSVVVKSSLVKHLSRFERLFGAFHQRLLPLRHKATPSRHIFSKSGSRRAAKAASEV